jgi:hypothetical protein
LYATDEPHYPLSKIGHKDTSVALKSKKERGMKSVSERISKLVSAKKKEKKGDKNVT